MPATDSLPAPRPAAAHADALAALRHTPIAFVGAGRVARALAEGLLAAGVPVVAVAGRSATGAAALAAQLHPAPRACDAQAAVDAAGLVFLTVPDDAIAATAAALRWRAGQAVVHCSGATEVAVLAPAAAAGAQVGGFHPLQIFSDPQRAAALLAGSSVAIEAAPPLAAHLHALAAALGMHALALPPGARLRYHAGAGYAASFWLPLLQEAAALWAGLGIDEAAALRALLPLARGTLATLEARGLAGTLSGPISRGDAGVLRRQLDALAALGPAHAELYRTLARPQLALAARAGRLGPAQLEALRQALEAPLPDAHARGNGDGNGPPR